MSQTSISKAREIMSPNPQIQPKPTVTRNSSEFNKDAYASIPAGELIVFAVQVLQADGSPAATEDIVSICFRFFPHSFALKNYFYWPDSALVTRRLHDAKEKGLLKGNAADGFETKVQGRQVAKHVAKALGVLLPVPPKLEVPESAEKKEGKRKEEGIEAKGQVEKVQEPVSSLSKQVKRKIALSGANGAIERTQNAKRKTQGGKADVKREVKVIAKKGKQKPVKKIEKRQTVKRKVARTQSGKVDVKRKVKAMAEKERRTPAPKPEFKKIEEKRETSKKEARPAVKPEVKKVKPKVGKAVEKKQATSKKKVQPKAKPVVKKVEPKAAKKVEKKEAKAQPKQLTIPLPPPAAWKKAGVPAIKPRVKFEPPPIGDKKPVKKEAAAPAAISKEEKDKAAKVVKQIERSDAYQLYRRSGRRANIGEFDFRNMLFATMESSAETLNRNVDLFKRYAGMQYRSDLVAFLEFCEGYFAALLKSKAKKSFRR